MRCPETDFRRICRTADYIEIKYLFGIKNYTSKKYELFQIKKDTLISEFTIHDYFDDSYMYSNLDLIEIEPPELIGKSEYNEYRQYYTYRINKDSLILSRAKYKKFN